MICSSWPRAWVCMCICSLMVVEIEKNQVSRLLINKTRRFSNKNHNQCVLNGLKLKPIKSIQFHFIGRCHRVCVLTRNSASTISTVQIKFRIYCIMVTGYLLILIASWCDWCSDVLRNDECKWNIFLFFFYCWKKQPNLFLDPFKKCKTLTISLLTSIEIQLY